MLQTGDPKQLRTRKGLETGRENIIIPGLEIYQEVLATIGCEGMIVSDAGLLGGILLSITET
jgi:exopolyphosphatase/pppGpp-phosphohydrolase